MRLLLLAHTLILTALFGQSPAIKSDPEILNAPASTNADLALAPVRRLIEAGDLAAAEEAIRQFLDAHTNSADAHYLLGYILFRQQKAEASLAAYTQGARYRNPSAYDLEVVACDYVLLKDYSDADKWFSKSLEFNPANAQARYYLGRAKYNENRFEEAVQAFEQCLQLDPKNVKAQDNLGLSLEGLGRTDAAIAAYRKAIQWQSELPLKSSRPYLDLGALLIASDRPSEAIQPLQAAAQIDPKDPAVHRQLGKAFFHLQRLSDARNELETATQLDPQNAPTHFILAQVYRRLGLPDKAHLEDERYSSIPRQQ